MRRLLSIIIMLTLFSVPLMAQDCDSSEDPFCDNEGTDIPIDGGALALLAAGAALGYKALKKKKEEDSEAL